MMQKTLTSLLVIMLGQQGYADGMDIRSAFNAVAAVPTGALALRNSQPLQTAGGHLQGVQQLGGQLLVSGSSSDYAYLAVTSTQTGAVSRVEILGKKPMKHAGGFQVSGEWLAIGIEDNALRTRSEVQVYRGWSGTTNLPAPVATIVREGPYQRATAGAVGIAALGNTLWLVVGDWDSKHLDFYRAVSDEPTFVLAFSLDTDQLRRDDWVDNNWASYQNLNLFAEDKNLWLVGTTSAGKGSTADGEIADLYRVDTVREAITKVDARRLASAPDAYFRWGAGFTRHSDGAFSILVTPENIDQHWSIWHYGPLVMPNAQAGP